MQLLCDDKAKGLHVQRDISDTVASLAGAELATCALHPPAGGIRRNVREDREWKEQWLGWGTFLHGGASLAVTRLTGATTARVRLQPSSELSQHPAALGQKRHVTSTRSPHWALPWSKDESGPKCLHSSLKRRRLSVLHPLRSIERTEEWSQCNSSHSSCHD